ncbi:hypothetical protein, partial [Vibrio vulnificus]|uniref:hypothetical protein n=1 Tax=Vibrio vulnificus TaxID=672 RepID=UPI0024DFB1A6
IIGVLMTSHSTSASHCLQSAEINLNGEWRLTSPQRPGICVQMTITGDNVCGGLQVFFFKETHVLYDLKYVLKKQNVDMRL